MYIVMMEVAMLSRAREGSVRITNTLMPYVTFGKGTRHLVILPGLGDGFRTVKGAAIPLAWMYRAFAKDYRIWIFSRKEHLEEGISTRDMARELKRAFEILGIQRASVMGISMGGMIAQYLAIDFPEVVDKLILVVSISTPNPLMVRNLTYWMELAKEGDYESLMKDSTVKYYSEKTLKRKKWLLPIAVKATKPKSMVRFLRQAHAALYHDAYEELHKIHAPTLLIGGGKDMTLGPDASIEMAERIRGCHLYIYPKLGHAAYEEARNFKPLVLQFLRS